MTCPNTPPCPDCAPELAGARHAEAVWVEAERDVFADVPRPDCYDLHRARWEATEDVIELAAMLDCRPPVVLRPLLAVGAWVIWRRRAVWAVGWVLYWVSATYLLLTVFR